MLIIFMFTVLIRNILVSVLVLLPHHCKWAEIKSVYRIFLLILVSNTVETHKFSSTTKKSRNYR